MIEEEKNNIIALQSRMTRENLLLDLYKSYLGIIVNNLKDKIKVEDFLTYEKNNNNVLILRKKLSNLQNTSKELNSFYKDFLNIRNQLINSLEDNGESLDDVYSDPKYLGAQTKFAIYVDQVSKVLSHELAKDEFNKNGIISARRGQEIVNELTATSNETESKINNEIAKINFNNSAFLSRIGDIVTKEIVKEMPNLVNLSTPNVVSFINKTKNKQDAVLDYLLPRFTATIGNEFNHIVSPEKKEEMINVAMKKADTKFSKQFKEKE
jgi:hypothetical protein